MNIAIDGPAGAGKSSIAKLVAKKLNYVYGENHALKDVSMDIQENAVRSSKFLRTQLRRKSK